jgi:hypothetical protein
MQGHSIPMPQHDLRMSSAMLADGVESEIKRDMAIKL